MIGKYIKIPGLVVLLLMVWSITARAEAEKKEFNPQYVIFQHLGDEYGWKIELPGDKSVAISLPVILRKNTGEWCCFSSSRLENGKEYRDVSIAKEGDYAGKIVVRDENGGIYRPLDLSVTKNVLATVICALVLCFALLPLVRWYKRNPLKAPRRGIGLIEMMIGMVYTEVIVSVLGQRDAHRFGPYLLTLFFFILFSNWLGMIVVFPGGANVMGNVSATLVLAILTFLIVNVSGTKKYWKEIFWPDVPTWLKFPFPIMPLVEIFGIFTKPIALMIRLFANMMAGHLITLVLISLIFVFGAWGAWVMGTTTVVAVSFALFMNVIDFLIGFIQAYVFMMLSAIFISLARV